MKRLIKKNQVIVAALALMIAAAGYLNYSGKLFSDKDDTKTAQQANSELLDISEEDIDKRRGQKYCGAGKSIQRAGAGEE